MISMASTPRIMKISALYIGILPAVCFVFFPIYLFFQSDNVDKAHFLLAEGIEVKGSVIDREIYEDSESSDEYYIQYLFKVDEAEYENWFEVKYHQYKRYKIGREITITYDPIDHSYFMAVDEANNAIKDYNLGWKMWPYMGVITFLAGLLYWAGYRMEPIHYWE